MLICLCYIAALKVEVMKKKNFVGVVFPDVTDIFGLEMSEEPGLVTFVPPNKYQIRHQKQPDGTYILYIMCACVGPFVRAFIIYTFSTIVFWLVFCPTYIAQSRPNS